jgi:hypothetical protein
LSEYKETEKRFTKYGEGNMKYKLVVVILIALFASFVFLMVFDSYKSDKARIFATFEAQIKSEKFSEIYEDSSDFAKLNVSKEEFQIRIKDAITRMKTADPNLHFERDFDTENFIEKLQESDVKYTTFGRPFSFSTYHKLGQGEQSIKIFVSWQRYYFSYRFFDLSIHPNSDMPKELSLPTIVGKIN